MLTRTGSASRRYSKLASGRTPCPDELHEKRPSREHYGEEVPQACGHHRKPDEEHQIEEEVAVTGVTISWATTAFSSSMERMSMRDSVIRMYLKRGTIPMIPAVIIRPSNMGHLRRSRYLNFFSPRKLFRAFTFQREKRAAPHQ